MFATLFELFIVCICVSAFFTLIAVIVYYTASIAVTLCYTFAFLLKRVYSTRFVGGNNGN